MCVLGAACGEGCLRNAAEVIRCELPLGVMIDADLSSRLDLNARFAGCGGSRAPTPPPLPPPTQVSPISRADSRTVTQGSPKFFTGTVKVEQLFAEDAPSRVLPVESSRSRRAPAVPGIRIPSVRSCSSRPAKDECGWKVVPFRRSRR